MRKAVLFLLLLLACSGGGRETVDRLESFREWFARYTEALPPYLRDYAEAVRDTVVAGCVARRLAKNHSISELKELAEGKLSPERAAKLTADVAEATRICILELVERARHSLRHFSLSSR